MYWTGSSWQADQMSTNGPYTNIISDNKHNDYFYAARAGGGVDEMTWHNSAWVVDSVNSNTYTTLAPSGSGSAAYSFVGMRAGGGLDAMAYGDAWTTQQVNANTYKAIDANRVGGSSPEYYGIRAGGGLDDITYSGDAWSTAKSTPTATRRLPATGYMPMNIYAAKAGGGLYDYAYGGSSWAGDLMSNHEYSSLATSSQKHNEVFGGSGQWGSGGNRLGWQRLGYRPD